MADQQNLYTLAEAAERTGLSTEALRLRVKRGKLAAEKGNDGQPRVRLTAADLDEFRRRAARQKSTLIRLETDSANVVKALEAQVETLREVLGRERDRAGQAEALANHRAEEVTTLREQMGRAEGVAQARQERIAAVEAELAAWRRLPWWRRALFRP